MSDDGLQSSDPSLASSYADQRGGTAFRKLRAKANEHAKGLVARAREIGIGSANEWSADLTKGDIEWVFDEGRLAGRCQVVGTWAQKDRSFLWSWANKSLPDQVTESADQTLEYGLANEIPELTVRKEVLREDEVWDMANITTLIAGDWCAYRSTEGPVHLYLTFKDLVWEE